MWPRRLDHENLLSDGSHISPMVRTEDEKSSEGNLGLIRKKWSEMERQAAPPPFPKGHSLCLISKLYSPIGLIFCHSQAHDDIDMELIVWSLSETGILAKTA